MSSSKKFQRGKGEEDMTTKTAAAKTTPEYSPGLEGVIAGETTVSYVNPELATLIYRGYDIRDLVEKATFEEVAFLLLYKHLPTQAEYDSFTATLKEERKLPQGVVDAIKTFPKSKPAAHPMDLLRTATAVMALYDPERDDNSHDANVRKAVRLVAKMPALITYSYRTSRGQEIIEPDMTLGHTSNFLYMLLGKKPEKDVVRLFDASLICYADHGFNASTFSARVVTSTLSDIYSGVVAAIGALKGPLHGGANEEAMHMLQKIGGPENAEKWMMDALARKDKIMGFGHREYKNGDPRAAILSRMAGEYSEKIGDTKWHETALICEKVMLREKNIQPNVDFSTSYLYFMMGLPIEIYTPIFALSRISGWTTHIIEQLDNNRLIRPKALYEGPTHLNYVPRAER